MKHKMRYFIPVISTKMQLNLLIGIADIVVNELDIFISTEDIMLDILI